MRELLHALIPPKPGTSRNRKWNILKNDDQKKRSLEFACSNLGLALRGGKTALVCERPLSQLSHDHSGFLWRVSGEQRAPRPVSCAASPSVRPLAFPRECDWNVICWRMECLGHGLSPEFHQPPGITSPFSHNATEKRKKKLYDKGSRQSCTLTRAARRRSRAKLICRTQSRLWGRRNQEA